MKEQKRYGDYCSYCLRGKMDCECPQDLEGALANLKERLSKEGVPTREYEQMMRSNQ